MNNNKHSWHGATTLVVLILWFSQAIVAGPISKPLEWLATKCATKSASTWRKVTQLCFETNFKYVSKKYGSGVANKAVELAIKPGVNLQPWEILHEIDRYGSLYKRSGFSDDALQFGIKYGNTGRFFVNRYDLFSSFKKAGGLATGNERIVTEVGRIVDGIGGSWPVLIETIKKSENVGAMKVGLSRDFCEPLFEHCVKVGRLRDKNGAVLFPKGTELFSGHIFNESIDEASRHGIDFILPNRNGKLSVIEFGTGMKPVSGELEWDRIRDRLARYIETTPNKDQLRVAGINPNMLDPKKIRDPQFPIENYVTREIYAIKLNGAELGRLKRETRGEILACELQ